MRKPAPFRTLLSVAPLLAVLGAGVTACSPDAPTGAPTAPTAPAPRQLLGLDPLLKTTTTLLTSTLTGTVKVVTNTVGGLLGLLTCSPQNQLSARKYIGPFGGTIAVGNHELVVPAGALSQTVLITATQKSGTIAMVDFQPHGLKFAKPATLRMSYRTCSTSASAVQSVVYLNDSNQIVETPPSADDAKSDAVQALINHFSGYAVATRTQE